MRTLSTIFSIVLTVIVTAGANAAVMLPNSTGTNPLNQDLFFQNDQTTAHATANHHDSYTWGYGYIRSNQVPGYYQDPRTISMNLQTHQDNPQRGHFSAEYTWQHLTQMPESALYDASVSLNYPLWDGEDVSTINQLFAGIQFENYTYWDIDEENQVPVRNVTDDTLFMVNLQVDDMTIHDTELDFNIWWVRQYDELGNLVSEDIFRSVRLSWDVTLHGNTTDFSFHETVDIQKLHTEAINVPDPITLTLMLSGMPVFLRLRRRIQ